MSISIALIAAVARNGAIGKDNELPWRISGDLQFFKRTTLAKPVVMGRKTFESIGRPLPGRLNIVITRNPGWSAGGVEVVQSLDAALRLAQKRAADSGASEIMVIGGAQIYRQALPLAARLYVTEVDTEVEGDAFFPNIDDSWVESVRECYPASDRNEYNYSLVQYDRFK
ncbi:dihydrofolate reductase [Microbulbifer sp. OS29]|uniref:Dihydrofolate reductase n=1 Tax=Microbulbifer okhotskensis TaxID=2926617 RepID=A0A9X2EKM2_9GAMM|nr:dihydrofolate reductase [Microbulbifer okhotskensis]MCO1333384.1 dihydrofolate reductase [Microbulbifer okhotskensis]